MQQYHLINLYSMLSWMWLSSRLLPLRPSRDESECQVAEPALRISGLELMKALNVWRVEEWRVGGMLF